LRGRELGPVQVEDLQKGGRRPFGFGGLFRLRGGALAWAICRCKLPAVGRRPVDVRRRPPPRLV
jgi:hypothetical protein